MKREKGEEAKREVHEAKVLSELREEIHESVWESGEDDKRAQKAALNQVNATVVSQYAKVEGDGQTNVEESSDRGVMSEAWAAAIQKMFNGASGEMFWKALREHLFEGPELFWEGAPEWAFEEVLWRRIAVSGHAEVLEAGAVAGITEDDITVWFEAYGEMQGKPSGMVEPCVIPKEAYVVVIALHHALEDRAGGEIVSKELYSSSVGKDLERLFELLDCDAEGNISHQDLLVFIWRLEKACSQAAIEVLLQDMEFTIEILQKTDGSEEEQQGGASSSIGGTPPRSKRNPRFVVNLPTIEEFVGSYCSGSQDGSQTGGRRAPRLPPIQSLKELVVDQKWVKNPHGDAPMASFREKTRFKYEVFQRNHAEDVIGHVQRQVTAHKKKQYTDKAFLEKSYNNRMKNVTRKKPTGKHIKPHPSVAKRASSPVWFLQEKDSYFPKPDTAPHLTTYPPSARCGSAGASRVWSSMSGTLPAITLDPSRHAPFTAPGTALPPIRGPVANDMNPSMRRPMSSVATASKLTILQGCNFKALRRVGPRAKSVGTGGLPVSRLGKVAGQGHIPRAAFRSTF